MDDMSCQTESTFVRVIKKNKKYKYKYYLGCGKKDDEGDVVMELVLPDQTLNENDRVQACNDAS